MRNGASHKCHLRIVPGGETSVPTSPKYLLLRHTMTSYVGTLLQSEYQIILQSDRSMRLFKSSKVTKKAKNRNWYNQVPHMTQGTTCEFNKNTKKTHTRETRGQRFPSR